MNNIKLNIQSKNTQQPASYSDINRGAIMNALNAATFNFGDDAVAGILAVQAKNKGIKTPFSELKNNFLNELKANQAQYQEKYPNLSTLGGLSGAVTSGVGAAKAVPSVFDVVSPGTASIGGSFLNAAKVGGASMGLSEVGNQISRQDQTPVEKTTDVALSGGIGAGAGLASELILSGLSKGLATAKIGRYLPKQFFKTPEEKLAAEFYGERVDLGLPNIEMAQQKAAQAKAKGIDITTAEALQDPTLLAEQAALARSGGETSVAAKEFAQTREGQAKTALLKEAETLKNPSPEKYYQDVYTNAQGEARKIAPNDLVSSGLPENPLYQSLYKRTKRTYSQKYPEEQFPDNSVAFLDKMRSEALKRARKTQDLAQADNYQELADSIDDVIKNNIDLETSVVLGNARELTKRGVASSEIEKSVAEAQKGEVVQAGAKLVSTPERVNEFKRLIGEDAKNVEELSQILADISSSQKSLMKLPQARMVNEVGKETAKERALKSATGNVTYLAGQVREIGGALFGKRAGQIFSENDAVNAKIFNYMANSEKGLNLFKNLIQNKDSIKTAREIGKQLRIGAISFAREELRPELKKEQLQPAREWYKQSGNIKL